MLRPGTLGAAFASCVLAAQPGSAAPETAGRTAEPAIHIEDVARFYEVYDAARGHPTAEALQRDYIEPGSPGLRHLEEIRHVTGATIAAAIAAHPEIYANAKRCLPVLPRVRERVADALRRLGGLYPKAVLPAVTVVITRGKPAGVADAQGVIIGLDPLCALNYLNPDVEGRFVHAIAHEYIHVQQAMASPAFYDDPKPTVLAVSLIEGAAEFVAARIAQEDQFRSPYAPAIRADDAAIESRFVAEQDDTDTSTWVGDGTLTAPGDLGYWIGYRIVESYYERAADKRRAMRDIIEIHDPKAFLAGSGWHPGAP